MDLQRIRAHLGPHPWADTIQVLASTDSTNTRAKALALTGAPQGTVVIADHQTGGRGRLGRSFHSPAGVGTYLSVLLRPDAPPDRFLHLTAMAAGAVAEAVTDAAGVTPAIKWTNDLVLDRKKFCGILTELVLTPTGPAVVVGVGCNCNQTDFPADIAPMATSLAQYTGQTVDRDRLCAAQIAHLAAMARTLLTDTTWLDRYRAACITLGQDVKLVRGDQVRYAHALDITDEAALLVRLPDGTTEAIATGEVSVRGMYGYL